MSLPTDAGWAGRKNRERVLIVAFNSELLLYGASLLRRSSGDDHHESSGPARTNLRQSPAQLDGVRCAIVICRGLPETGASWTDSQSGAQEQIATLPDFPRLHRPGPPRRPLARTGLISRCTTAWSDVPTACFRRTTVCERCTK